MQEMKLQRSSVLWHMCVMAHVCYWHMCVMPKRLAVYVGDGRRPSHETEKVLEQN